MNKKSFKIIIVMVAILALSFFWGDLKFSSDKVDLKKEETVGLVKDTEDKVQDEKEGPKDEAELVKEEKEDPIEDIELKIDEKDIQSNKKVTKEGTKDRSERKKPIESKDIKETNKEETVSIKVSANSLLKNMDKLDKNKHGLVPASGVIYINSKAEIREGDTVFDLLSRELRANGIHLESSMTPVYNTNYVEGINNIYEFDAGELSGWMYKVNGSFPSYGSSEVKIKSGDVIEWMYTCDLGKDIGGKNATGGRR